MKRQIAVLVSALLMGGGTYAQNGAQAQDRKPTWCLMHIWTHSGTGISRPQSRIMCGIRSARICFC